VKDGKDRKGIAGARPATMSDPNPNGFRADMLQLAQPPGLVSVKAEVPVNLATRRGRGRPRKVRSEILPILLQRSNQLFIAMPALIALHEAAPKRSCADIVQFLKLDYPHEMSFLSQHLIQMQNTLNGKDLKRIPKTRGPYLRKLADSLAGAEFDLSPSYSARVTADARRLALRSQKTAR
jgi:hypothetical protein